MRLGFLQNLYDHPGPFATVYLDTSGDAEDADKALELRWRSAREQLVDQGADEATLQAIERELGEHRWRAGQRGQIIVATAGGVVFADELPSPPSHASDDEIAHVGTLPRLFPYVRMSAARVPHVIAVVDHQGADITVVNARRRSGSTSVEGDDSLLHKSRTGGEGNEQRHQNAVEETWKQNAAEVADAISKRALAVDAEVIVLGGDVQQRKLVREQIRKGLQKLVVDTDASHRAPKASTESLHQEVAHTIDATVDSQVAAKVEEFQRERGENDRAVEGWQATTEALQYGQAETVLRVVDGSESSEVSALWIGPEAGLVAVNEAELTGMGVATRASVPADEALIRALAATDASLMLLDGGTADLKENVGAVLRYSIQPTGE